MTADSRRKDLRLKHWNYGWPATYLITTCIQHREHRFGTIVANEMRLNDAGEMVASIWEEIPVQFPTAKLDAYVVMPNHLHGIVTMNHEAISSPEVQLGSVMKWFKTVTTNHYIRGVISLGWPPYDRRLWQRNYYETIISSERVLDIKRGYIESNPANWAHDTENTLPVV